MNKCVIIGGSHFLAYPLEFWKGECVWVWVPLTHARWSCLLPDLMLRLFRVAATWVRVSVFPQWFFLVEECMGWSRVLSFLLLHLKGRGS